LIFSIYSLLNPDFKVAAAKINTIIGGILSVNEIKEIGDINKIYDQ